MDGTTPAGLDQAPTTLDPTPRYALAFDVGGTDTKIGFVSREGSLLKLPSVPTARGGASGLVEQLRLLHLEIEHSLQDGEIHHPDGQPLGVKEVCSTLGVAVPGLIDEESGMTIRSANLGWKDFPMRDALSQALQTSVALGHDVRSGALGEALFTARGNCFFVAIGTGISAGIVWNGRLLNRGGTTGEIGQVLFSNPDLAILKNRPAPRDLPTVLPLERIASAKSMSRRYALVTGMAEGSEPPTSKEVFSLERAGDEAAHHVVDSGIACLGKVLASSLATLGNLEIIIGGGQSKEGPDYLQRIQEATLRHLVNLPEPKFSLARFGSRAQLLGVGAQAFEKAGIPLLPSSSAGEQAPNTAQERSTTCPN